GGEHGPLRNPAAGRAGYHRAHRPGAQRQRHSRLLPPAAPRPLKNKPPMKHRPNTEQNLICLFLVWSGFIRGLLFSAPSALSSLGVKVSLSCRDSKSTTTFCPS